MKITSKPYEELSRVMWIHLDHLIDLNSFDTIMQFHNNDEFNFKMYYLDDGKISIEERIEKVFKKAKL
jgi:hypothetical protein